MFSVFGSDVCVCRPMKTRMRNASNKNSKLKQTSTRKITSKEKKSFFLDAGLRPREIYGILFFAVFWLVFWL